MVGRDMVTRLRPPFGVTALLLAVFAWGWLSVDPPESHRADHIEQSAVSVAAPHPRSAGHTLRPQTIPFGLALVAVARVSVILLARDLLVGRWRRRVGDVGESWRALLLGAPPRFV